LDAVFSWKHSDAIFIQINAYDFRQNSRTAVRLKVLEMLASVISTNSVLYRVSFYISSAQFRLSFGLFAMFSS